MMWLSHLLLLGVVCSIVFADWMDCPASCSCKWVSGKKSAFCPNAHLTTIPGILSSELQVLDLSGNKLPYLTKEVFKSVGLLNLQKIFLKASGVQELHSEAFNELTILVEVDLSDNSIATLHKDTFSGNSRLRVLYLNGNPLTELHAAQFPKLPSLKTLEMQHCKISKIHKDAFIHLPSIEMLSLNGNRLKTVSEKVFLPLTQLKSLSLDGNPWKCDCGLRGFRNWLLSSKLFSHSLICKEPFSLAFQQWDTILPLAFSCSPSVQVTEAMIQKGPGENVTLICQVQGDPEPDISWLLNGRFIVNSSQDQVRLVEEEDGEVKAEKWSLLSLLNVSEEDAGEYTCIAKNIGGQAAINISLILPEVVIATTVSKNETWLIWAIWGGCGGGVVLAMLLILCLILRFTSSSSRYVRQGKIKQSESYTDQDKKLLDVSIATTTDRQTGSCEGLESQADMQLLEHSIQSIPLEVSDQVPVTMESRAPDSVSLYQPPPMFSTSIFPQGPYGNIFISVSVSQEARDNQRYPDLLEMPHRKSVGVCTDVAYFATLPKRMKKTEPVVRMGPQYDNMGPRVTACGSSNISLPDSTALDDIPPPPPPPNTTSLIVEYVSL